MTELAHRISDSPRLADVIVVLDEGTIAEAGDHATLMASGGGYAELFALQAAGYQ